MTRRFLTIRPLDASLPSTAFSPMEKMMRDMFRTFGDFTSSMALPYESEKMLSIPRGDFYRKDGKIFMEFELPGVDPSKVELSVFEDRLSLKAEKSDEKAVEENDFFRSERYYGTVSRDIQFPVEVDPDSAKASFRNGVLTVEIAEKVQAERMKKVSIETAGE